MGGGAVDEERHTEYESLGDLSAEMVTCKVNDAKCLAELICV